MNLNPFHLLGRAADAFTDAIEANPLTELATRYNPAETFIEAFTEWPEFKALAEAKKDKQQVRKVV